LNSKLFYIKLLKAPLFLGVFIFMFSCENDIQEIRELTAKQDSAIYSAFNVEIKYSTNGKTTGLMKAKVLNRFIEADGKTYINEFPEGMHMIFYNKEGKATSNLKSNYSIYYEDEGRWIAKYDVEVVNENNEKLNTEYLIWLRDEEKITSDQWVKITTEDGVFYGDNGFVSNQEFTSWKIFNINDSFIDFEDEK
jgi:LPS export ABC transporter protein LptC